MKLLFHFAISIFVIFREKEKLSKNVSWMIEINFPTSLLVQIKKNKNFTFTIEEPSRAVELNVIKMCTKNKIKKTKLNDHNVASTKSQFYFSSIIIAPDFRADY